MSQAQLVRIVIDEKRIDRTDLFDRLAISERIGDAMLTQLCREGTLKSSGGFVSVGNLARAELRAEGARGSAMPALVGVTAEPPAILASKKIAQRAEIPVPTDLKIEAGIPIPPPRTTKKPCLWPFANMAIGDSFAISVPDGMEPKNVSALLAREATSYKRTDPTFRVAIRIEDGCKSVRLWREASKVAEAAPPAVPSSSLGIRARGRKAA